MKTIKFISLTVLMTLILTLTGCALSEVKTKEEVIKDAGQYCKCELIDVELKPDSLGKTDWTVYEFRDLSLGFTFEYVVYLKHYIVFGKQIGFGTPTHSCNWEAMRDKYLTELNN